MKIWGKEISTLEVVRWDLFQDAVECYIRAEAIGGFPADLSLAQFFSGLIVPPSHLYP